MTASVAPAWPSRRAQSLARVLLVLKTKDGSPQKAPQIKLTAWTGLNYSTAKEVMAHAMTLGFVDLDDSGEFVPGAPEKSRAAKYTLTSKGEDWLRKQTPAGQVLDNEKAIGRLGEMEWRETAYGLVGFLLHHAIPTLEGRTGGMLLELDLNQAATALMLTRDQFLRMVRRWSNHGWMLIVRGHSLHVEAQRDMASVPVNAADRERAKAREVYLKRWSGRGYVERMDAKRNEYEALMKPGLEELERVLREEAPSEGERRERAGGAAVEAKYGLCYI